MIISILIHKIWDDRSTLQWRWTLVSDIKTISSQNFHVFFFNCCLKVAVCITTFAEQVTSCIIMNSVVGISNCIGLGKHYDTAQIWKSQICVWPLWRCHARIVPLTQTMGAQHWFHLYIYLHGVADCENNPLLMKWWWPPLGGRC